MEAEVEAEAGVGDEPAWKTLFGRRVDMAHEHYESLLALLDGAIEAFDVGGDQEWRAEVAGAEEALRRLEDAATELSLTVTSAGAARHIALRCGVAGPLASTDGLLADDPGAQDALELLQDAADYSRRVHDSIESGRGHLGAARMLLVLEEDHVDGGGAPPWAPGPCKAEYLDGIMNLREAQSLAWDFGFLIIGARNAAFSALDEPDSSDSEVSPNS